MARMEEFDLGDNPTTIPEKFYNKVYGWVEKFAGTKIGQFIIAQTDRVLEIVEKTAKWSEPQITDPAEPKPSPPLERPVSWIPFLLLIVILRTIRITLSLGAIAIGNSPVSPTDMVNFIKIRRRKLRMIRREGARQEQESGSVISMALNLLSLAVCHPGRHSDEANERTEGNKKKQQRQSRSKSEADDELTVNELLDKYADAPTDSDDDSYVPEPNEHDDSDTSHASGDDDYLNASDKDPEKETETVASQHDSSVEIKENGDESEMPQPIKDIKQETEETSDTSSETETENADSFSADISNGNKRKGHEWNGASGNSSSSDRFNEGSPSLYCGRDGNLTSATTPRDMEFVHDIMAGRTKSDD